LNYYTQFALRSRDRFGIATCFRQPNRSRGVHHPLHVGRIFASA
jgi:hypothetical protein